MTAPHLTNLTCALSVMSIRTIARGFSKSDVV